MRARKSRSILPGRVVLLSLLLISIFLLLWIHSTIRSSSPHRHTLNVVFWVESTPYASDHHRGRLFETDWILRTVLAGVERPLRVVFMQDELGVMKPGGVYNDSLNVVFSDFHDSRLEYVVTKYNVKNWGVYHLADEDLVESTMRYCYENADFVFRNYFDAKRTWTGSKYVWIPLGIKSGFGGQVVGNTLLSASRRPMMCNFVGSIDARRPDRRDMVQVLRAHDLTYNLSRNAGRESDVPIPWYDFSIRRSIDEDSNNRLCYLQADRAWASQNGLHIIHYRNILENSVFTLSPWGNNPESMRIYEAMEAGSIPIFKKILELRKDFVNYGLKNAPFLMIDSWNELPGIFAKYQNDPVALDELQSRVVQFWREYKMDMQHQVKLRIDAAFGKRYGPGG